MAIDRARRALLRAGAAGLGAIAIRQTFGATDFARQCSAASSADDRRWPTLAGIWTENGSHHAGLWTANGGVTRSLRLPARAHGIVADPLHPDVVVVIARRPGDFILRFHAREGTRLQFADTEADRVFN